jgi:hypothetical protein
VCGAGCEVLGEGLKDCFARLAMALQDSLSSGIGQKLVICIGGISPLSWKISQVLPSMWHVSA